jgi:tetratricopeptide (TPR) repeat protein
MRKIQIILHKLLLLILNLYGFSEAFSQPSTVTCPISIEIGSETICMPQISGMTECINREEILKFVNERSFDGNLNLAFYLDNKYLKDIANLENKYIENYVIVYSTKELEFLDIDESFIIVLDSLVSTNYKDNLDSNWTIIKELISKKRPEIDIDQPVLLEHYLIEKNVPCNITLTRFTNNENDSYYLTATVTREINGKFLAYAWYLNYDFENALEKLKSKINYFSLLITQSNFGSDSRQKKKSANNYFDEAYSESNKGNFVEAINLYSLALDIYPKSDTASIVKTYFNRALNKRYNNDLKGAIIDYSNAIKLKPDYFKGYLNRGFAKMKNEDFVEAIADFTKIINSDCKDLEIISNAYWNRGFSKASIGNDGCSDYQKAATINITYIDKFKELCK